MQLTLSQIAKATNGKLIGDDIIVDNFHFDSREIKSNGFFIPLVINDTDAHTYIDSAINNGAVASFIDSKHQITNNNISYIQVEDNHQALLILSKWYRSTLKSKVIAVTGSNGKTTTKDMIADILASKYQTVKTFANFNNEIGVSMTILTADLTTQMLVVEIGMDRPGQIDQLVDIVRPDIAVINMIGEAHLEFFKTQDKIADAKFEILNHFADNDKFLIYNADQELIVERVEKIDPSINKVSFGLANGDVKAESINYSNNLIEFMVENVNFKLNIFGQYNLINALAAIATTKILGFELEQQSKILENFHLTTSRTETIILSNGTTVISDIYNANPTAMKLVLDEFSENSSKNKIAILGEMYELGDQEIKLHDSLYSNINPEKINYLFLVGEKFKSLFEKIKNKYSSDNLFYFDKNQFDQLNQKLTSLTNQDTTILIKGSHGVHLDELLKKL